MKSRQWRLFEEVAKKTILLGGFTDAGPTLAHRLRGSPSLRVVRSSQGEGPRSTHARKSEWAAAFALFGPRELFVPAVRSQLGRALRRDGEPLASKPQWAGPWCTTSSTGSAAPSAPTSAEPQARPTPDGPTLKGRPGPETHVRGRTSASAKTATATPRPLAPPLRPSPRGEDSGLPRPVPAGPPFPQPARDSRGPGTRRRDRHPRKAGAGEDRPGPTRPPARPGSRGVGWLFRGGRRPGGWAAGRDPGERAGGAQRRNLKSK